MFSHINVQPRANAELSLLLVLIDCDVAEGIEAFNGAIIDQEGNSITANSDTGDTTLGSMRMFSCDGGEIVVSASSITCEYTGNWSDVVPRCGMEVFFIP